MSDFIQIEHGFLFFWQINLQSNRKFVKIELEFVFRTVIPQLHYGRFLFPFCFLSCLAEYAYLQSDVSQNQISETIYNISILNLYRLSLKLLILNGKG